MPIAGDTFHFRADLAFGGRSQHPRAEVAVTFADQNPATFQWFPLRPTDPGPPFAERQEWSGSTPVMPWMLDGDDTVRTDLKVRLRVWARPDHEPFELDLTDLRPSNFPLHLTEPSRWAQLAAWWRRATGRAPRRRAQPSTD